MIIASDGKRLSDAASTSGWPYKHPGRVGDAPLIGAGLYVDSRYGGACCAYTGEMATRAGTARFVVLMRLKAFKSYLNGNASLGKLHQLELNRRLHG